MSRKAIEYRPQPGAQEKFIASPADIAIYGGAAGGGKSWALLYESIRFAHVPGYGGVIFRRTSPQIRNEGGLWDESQEMFLQRGGVPVENSLTWRFPEFGTKIKFSHFEHDKNRFDWQGSQIPFIGFDELTHFTELQFFYMLSRNRSVCGVMPYIRATTNPSSTSWVRELIEWWIDADTGLAIPERSGVIRYFARIAGKLFFADSDEEIKQQFGGDVQSKSLTFIAASINDNRILMEKDPAYIANLMALPKVERDQLLNGNWNSEPEGDIITHSLLGEYGNLDTAGFSNIIIRVDTAEKTDEKNAYSVFGMFGIKYDDPDLYVLDLKRKRWEIDDLLIEAIAFFKKHHNQRHNGNPAFSDYGIEDKSSGTQLIQMMRRRGYGVSAISRSSINDDGVKQAKKKSERLSQVANHLKLTIGRIMLPNEPTVYTDAQWVDDYRSELLSRQHQQDTVGFWDQADVTSDAGFDLLINSNGLDASALAFL